MVMKRLRLASALGALIVGCSSGGSGSGRDRASTAPASDTTATTPGGTPAAAGSTATPGSPGLAPGVSPPVTIGPGVTTAPVFDPMAGQYAMDDTASSGLDQATLDRLRAGGTECLAPIIYPYQRTMFPGGLPSPSIMWNEASNATLVTARYVGLDTIDYQFAAGASSPGEITLPQEAWNEITRRTQPGTSLTLTVNSDVGGQVSTCELSIVIAQGNMIGSIYYNTYNAPGVSVPGNGAVMRLSLGQTQSEIYLQFPGIAAPATGPCISCHSVSFNGSTIVASTHSYVPGLQSFEVFSYPVTANVQPNPGPSVPNANYGALTPDGTKMLAVGNPQCTDGADSFPRAPNNFPLIEGPEEARLFDLTTGQLIEAKGLSPDWYMWMPQFSPSGNKVVFNHAQPDGNGGTDRRKLAVMDFDSTTNTFSNLRVIAQDLGPAPSQPYMPGFATGFPLPTPPLKGCMSEDLSGVGASANTVCDGPCYPAYPFFTPDGSGVIFSLINQPDFASALPGRTYPAKSELWYADLESGDVVAMDNVNRTLVESEAMQEYYPTVLPVPVGGHFWMVWTSRRAWGHRGTGDQINPLVSPAEDPFRKRLWAAAIRPKVATEENQVTGDPSYPGFYLEGQSNSGNVRAFAALNPCAPSGDSCVSGLDCCTGYCSIEPGQTMGICNEEPPECSKTNEKCETDMDCCPPGLDEPTNSCIAGFCNYLSVQ